MAANIDPLPGEAVAEALSARNANLSREVGLRVLRKVLDAEEQAAGEVLKLMGLGTRLDKTA